MYQKILVPYDKSEPARHALTQALSLIEGVDGASITVLNVIDWRDYNYETFKIASRMAGVVGEALDVAAIADVSDETAKKAKARIVADIVDIAKEAGDNFPVEIKIVNGSAHDTITAFAAEGGYDCIVMGHRGMGAVRGMLGSVCYSVLHKATTPVLIVK